MIDHKICEKCRSRPGYKVSKIDTQYPWSCRVEGRGGEYIVVYKDGNPPAGCCKMLEQAISAGMKKS